MKILQTKPVLNSGFVQVKIFDEIYTIPNFYRWLTLDHDGTVRIFVEEPRYNGRFNRAETDNIPSLKCGTLNIDFRYFYLENVYQLKQETAQKVVKLHSGTYQIPEGFPYVAEDYELRAFESPPQFNGIYWVTYNIKSVHLGRGYTDEPQETLEFLNGNLE